VARDLKHLLRMASPRNPDPRSAPRRRSWWTWNLGRLFGIPIRVHMTLLFLLAWIVAAHAMRGTGLVGTSLGLFLVLSIFAIIVVHELGHALMARRYGIGTRDILLLPIGGISRLECMPDNPRQELDVAIIGPVINLVLAAVLWGGITLFGGSTRIDEATTIGGAIATQLMWINVVLAVFNLLPAFPMDGGRVLRALLAMRMSKQRATDIAALLGKGFAALIGMFGLFYNPLLILIAVVVWFGASQERAMVTLKTAIAGVPVSAAMVRRVDAVAPDQLLEDAAALLVAGGLDSLPVIDHGRPLGVLTRADLATALAHAYPGATVATAPRHELITVSPRDPLEAVFERLGGDPDAVALVVDHGEPVGLLTADHLAQYVALHGRRAAA
jgi:Zn-dependent protease/CBS domain-containing protein